MSYIVQCIASRLVAKAPQLVDKIRNTDNLTTNLTESWMHIRTNLMEINKLTEAKEGLSKVVVLEQDYVGI